MAPEIIEMTGTTTACDVWSVGCTIIELLEGKPPYFDLPQVRSILRRPNCMPLFCTDTNVGYVFAKTTRHFALVPLGSRACGPLATSH